MCGVRYGPQVEFLQDALEKDKFSVNLDYQVGGTAGGTCMTRAHAHAHPHALPGCGLVAALLPAGPRPARCHGQTNAVLEGVAGHL